jgi:hypothetical protein
MSFLLLQSSFGIELLINFNVSSVVEAVPSKNLVLLWLCPWILSSHLLCWNKKERHKPSQVSVTKCPRSVIHKWSQNSRVEETNSGHKNPLLQLLLLVIYRVKTSWPSKVITTRPNKRTYSTRLLTPPSATSLLVDESSLIKMPNQYRCQ